MLRSSVDYESRLNAFFTPAADTEDSRHRTAPSRSHALHCVCKRPAEGDGRARRACRCATYTAKRQAAQSPAAAE